MYHKYWLVLGSRLESNLNKLFHNRAKIIEFKLTASIKTSLQFSLIYFGLFAFRVINLSQKISGLQGIREEDKVGWFYWHCKGHMAIYQLSLVEVDLWCPNVYYFRYLVAPPLSRTTDVP